MTAHDFAEFSWDEQEDVKALLASRGLDLGEFRISDQEKREPKIAAVNASIATKHRGVARQSAHPRFEVLVVAEGIGVQSDWHVGTPNHVV